MTASRRRHAPSDRPRAPLVPLALLAVLTLGLAGTVPAGAQETAVGAGGPVAERADTAVNLSVRPVVVGRFGAALEPEEAESVFLATGAAGIEVPLSRRLGLRADGEAIVALEDGSFAVGLRPAAVLFLGERAPYGPSLRAGPVIWSALGPIRTVPRILGPYLALDTPIGESGLQFEASASLLSGEFLLLELGLGWAF